MVVSLILVEQLDQQFVHLLFKDAPTLQQLPHKLVTVVGGSDEEPVQEVVDPLDLLTLVTIISSACSPP